MTLQFGTVEDIQQMFIRLRQEVRRLLMNVLELVYNMKGSISYNEMLHMPINEMSIIAEFIEKKLSID